MNAGERPFQGQTALVTGGLGFIGSATARALGALGANVRVLDSLLPQGGGTPRNLQRGARAFDVTIEDTRSRDVVNRVVEGADIVVHLASHDGISALALDWYAEVDIACLGTLNVLEAVRVHAPKAHFIFASSLAVYGRSDGRVITESSPTEPDTLFGVHKLTGEKYCGLYAREHGVRTTVARLSTVFGPGQRLRSAASNTLAYVIDAVLHDETIRLPNGGRQLLDVLYVDEAVAVLIALLASPDRAPAIINVARGASLSLHSLAERAIGAAGSGRLPSGGNLQSSDGAESIVADASSLRALGIAPPQRTLEDTIAETIAWYRGRTNAA